MHLHLCVLEELVHGLGTRSTRHVMTRGDLLALEILMYLHEGIKALQVLQAAIARSTCCWRSELPSPACGGQTFLSAVARVRHRQGIGAGGEGTPPRRLCFSMTTPATRVALSDLVPRAIC